VDLDLVALARDREIVRDADIRHHEAVLLRKRTPHAADAMRKLSL